MVPAVFASLRFRLAKVKQLNHSTVTLLARFRGLSTSQPSTKELRFLREPYDLTQIVRNEIRPISRFLRYAQKCLMRRTCGEPAQLYPVRNRVYSTVTLFGQVPGAYR